MSLRYRAKPVSSLERNKFETPQKGAILPRCDYSKWSGQLLPAQLVCIFVTWCSKVFHSKNVSVETVQIDVCWSTTNELGDDFSLSCFIVERVCKLSKKAETFHRNFQFSCKGRALSIFFRRSDYHAMHSFPFSPSYSILSLFFMIIEWLEINCAPSSSIRTTIGIERGSGGKMSCWIEGRNRRCGWQYIKLLQVAIGTKRLRNPINCYEILMNWICWVPQALNTLLCYNFHVF